MTSTPAATPMPLPAALAATAIAPRPLLSWFEACKHAENWVCHNQSSWRDRLADLYLALSRGKASVEAVTRRAHLELHRLFGAYCAHDEMRLDGRRSSCRFAAWVPFRSSDDTGIQLVVFDCVRGVLSMDTRPLLVTQHVLARLAERLGTDQLRDCLAELRPVVLSLLYRQPAELTGVNVEDATMWMGTEHGMLIAVPDECVPGQLVLTTWVEYLQLNGWQDIYWQHASDDLRLSPGKAPVRVLRYMAVTDAEGQYWLVHLAGQGEVLEPPLLLGTRGKEVSPAQRRAARRRAAASAA